MAKQVSNLDEKNLLLIPTVAAAVGAGLVTTSPAQAAPSPRGDIVARRTVDEDAFVQLRPTSGYTDKGTGFFNQFAVRARLESSNELRKDMAVGLRTRPRHCAHDVHRGGSLPW